MLKKYLKNREMRLQNMLADINTRAAASTDVNEIKSLTKQATEINDELSDIRSQLAEIEAEEKRSDLPPANATLVNPGVQSYSTTPAKRDNITASAEYREAFRAYVTNGTEIPAELRAGSANTTADTGAAIPITVMNEVVNTVRKRYGNLYDKVRKTSVPGGVKISVGALQASFKWITESTVSPRQKAGSLASITFDSNVAELRIATSFLANLLTLSAFEAALVEVIAVAYRQAMDTAIVLGSGDGAPLGILNDSRVTHVVEMTAAKFSNWKNWRSDFFAKLPLGYRSGEFIFAASTVDSKLLTMSDDNNNPVYYLATGLVVGDGDAQNPNGRFFGREVALVEPDILPDFDTADANDIVGIYWQPQDYMVNENFGFTVRRYFDEETNEWVDKALTVVDGKLVNAEGVYLIKKVSG